MISTDKRGVIEYWSPQDGSFPSPDKIDFTMKLETSLFDMAKEKVFALSLEVSIDGEQMVLYGSDKKIRVLRFRTGKLRRCYDESLAAAQVGR